MASTTRTITRIPARPRYNTKSDEPGKKIRLGAYVRVSTDGDEQLDSFENQVQYYKEYTVRHPEYELVDIYADEAVSGCNTRQRLEFKRMIDDCKAGKIDMIITKSITRFARNTQDFLYYVRMLKDMGIAVFFEKDHLNSMDGSSEFIFTLLSAMAQEESRTISDNSQWGFRALFKRGFVMVNSGNFFGYDKDKDGKLVINPEQGPIIQRIFREFMDGVSTSIIAKRLKNEGVPGTHGRSDTWNGSTIKTMLSNEKHMGDAMLQKYWTSDFLTGKTVRNKGEVEAHYVRGDHEPLVDRLIWFATQEEFKRRSAFIERHELRHIGIFTKTNPFSNKLFCGHCGRMCYHRDQQRLNGKRRFYICTGHLTENDPICVESRKIMQSELEAAFLRAWNEIIRTKDARMDKWLAAIDRGLKECEKDNPEEGVSLTAFRARQMVELMKDAEPVIEYDSALVAKMLEHIDFYNDGRATVELLDGTVVEVDYRL